MSKLKILIIGNQSVSSELIKKSLVDMGYGVTDIISKGENVIKSIEERRPDIILKDTEIARELLKQDDIPIVCYRFSNNEEGQLISPINTKELNINIEITHHKFKLEKEFEKKEALLKDTQYLAIVGHWERNLLTNELKWTDETFMMFGLKPREIEITQELFISMVHPDDLEIVNANSIEKAVSCNFNYRIVLRDGTIKCVNQKSRIVFDSKGTAIYSLGTVQDITGKKKAENNLIKREEHFRTLIENSSDVITILSPAGNILWSTTNSKTILGYDKEEIVGINMKDLLYEEDFIKLEKVLERVLTTPDRTYKVEYRAKTKQGSDKYIESKVRYINKEDRKSFIILNSQDITKRKRIQDKILTSERKFRDIFESYTDIFFRVNMDGICLLVSPSVQQITGFLSEELLQKPFVPLGETKKNEGWKKFREALMEKGVIYNYESCLETKAGKRVYTSTNARVIFNSRKEPILIEGSIRDVTEKKLIEEIPAENPNPIIRVDNQFKIIYANDAGKLWSKIIATKGLITDEKIKLSLQHLTENERNKLQIEFTKGGYTYLILLVHTGGGEINLYATDITELKNTQSDYLRLSKDLEKIVVKRTEELNKYVQGLNKEIKERKIIEEKISNSLKEKEVLLNEITHRVKNNLQVVASLLSLQQDNIKNKETMKMLTETGHRIKSMALIHETLYRTNDFSNIDFNEYTRSLVSYIANSFKASEIKINLEVEDVVLTIDTATSCGMIIMELITNSMKYAFPDKKGSITIKMEALKEEDSFKLMVSDDGVGYPDGVDFMKTKSLGMQLVCGLTFQMAGKINLIPSKGTCFEIMIKDTKKHKHAKK